ncbi:hypothetical protein ACD661_14145 [Legionella lytica]|uniref:Uncharacterized protein n=1 Tax=Legionella lytica TaxID=96232 RepID=A0ABW8DCK8_9GAMM
MKAKGLLVTEALLPIQLELFEYTIKQYPLVTEEKRKAAIQLIGHLNNILFNSVLENHIVTMEDEALMLAFITVPAKSIENKLREEHIIIDEILLSGLMACRQRYVDLLSEHLLHLENTKKIASHFTLEEQCSLIARLDGIKLVQEKSKAVSDLEKTVAGLPTPHLIFAPQLKKGLMEATLDLNLALTAVFSEEFLLEENLNNLSMTP